MNLMHLSIHAVSIEHWVVQGRVPQPFHVHLADSLVSQEKRLLHVSSCIVSTGVSFFHAISDCIGNWKLFCMTIAQNGIATKNQDNLNVQIC